MTMTCIVRRGRSPVSGPYLSIRLIGGRGWVVRRGETEGAEYVVDCSPPRQMIVQGEQGKTPDLES
jgi:hypothetical protein